MDRIQLTCLVALTATGCIFGGRDGKDVDANSTANNSNSQTDVGNPDIGMPDVSMPDVSMPDVSLPDASVPDMGAVETFLPLAAEAQACARPGTAFFAPTTLTDAVITQDSLVATAVPPRDVATLFGRIGEVSVAHVTPVEGVLHVYAGTAVLNAASREYEEFLGQEATIAVSADVLGLLLSPRNILRSDQNPAPELLQVMVATTEGVYECSLTIDMNDQTAFGCSLSPLNSVLAESEVAQAARVDAAPILDTLGTGELSLTADFIAAVSGASTDGEQLALLATSDGIPSLVTLTDLEPELADPRVFAERLAFGVEESAFGLPLLLALGQRVGEDTFGPVVLRANNSQGTSYVVEDRGAWNLSRDLQPRRGTFTFVDGYDVDIAGWTGFARFAPGDLSVGYVGIREDQSGLIFSRPDGFSGADYLEFDLPAAAEVVAHKNVPIESGASGRSVIAAIHGEERDRVAVFNWGFGIDAKYLHDALADGFTNAQRMGPVWFYSDVGAFSMLAQLDGSWVNAIVPIPDLKRLSESCP